MTDDDWSHPEIVRNLKALTDAVRELVTKVAALDDKFVTRREQELRDQHVDQMLDGLGRALVDVEADQERHHRDHEKAADKALELARAAAHEVSRSWQAWLIPGVTGAGVAVFAVIVSKLVGG